MKERKHSVLREFWRSARGVAALEFALVLPLLLLVSLPLYNYFQYILAIQKVNKATSTVADMITISLPTTASVDPDEIDERYLTTAKLQQILDTVKNSMLPLPFDGTTAQITVESYYKPVGGGAPYTAWRVMATGGTAINPGSIQTSPADGIVPPGFDQATMYNDEGVIVVEITYPYTPPVTIAPGLGIPMLSPATILVTQYYSARYGALNYFCPDVPPPGYACP